MGLTLACALHGQPLCVARNTRTALQRGRDDHGTYAPRARKRYRNRWFPPKAIQIWEGIHEFERPGLVSEYFLESGLFYNLETWSIRGLPRPEDDEYADRMPSSDPVYAVWGERVAS